MVLGLVGVIYGERLKVRHFKGLFRNSANGPSRGVAILASSLAHVLVALLAVTVMSPPALKTSSNAALSVLEFVSPSGDPLARAERARRSRANQKPTSKTLEKKIAEQVAREQVADGIGESPHESNDKTSAQLAASDFSTNSQTEGGGSVASFASVEAQYLSRLRHRLEEKKEYPLAARRLGHYGRVIVRFVLGRDGHVREAAIVEANGSDILNRAAKSLIDQVGRLDPFPAELRREEWAVVVPIDYKM